MIEVPIYLPSGDRFLLSTLAPRSAVVGRPHEEGGTLVYYEGNIYGAQNVVTFTDRAMFAYWRMRDSYPTIAMALVKPGSVEQNGILYPEHGCIALADDAELAKLARWLDIDLSQPDGERQMATELAVSGVRV